MKIGNTLTHNGGQFKFVKAYMGCLIWICEYERSCLVTDSNNSVIFEIEAKTICNSGFIKIV